ncbi:MAG TPA: tetratricopeptide repeat protein, partial [Kofleriaceae bacterium]
QATGDPDLDALSDFHAALGKAYAIAQRVADAEPHFRTALELSERALGPEHDQVGIALGNLANILQASKRSQEAIPLYRRALAILTRTRGKDHAMVLGTRQNLAGALTAIHDRDGALREYLSLLPAVEATAPDGELCGKVLHNIGLNRKEAGDDAAAERYFRRSLAHAERTHHDHLIARALWGIASLQLRAGRARDALPLLERALAIDGSQLGPTTEAVSELHLALGRTQLALHRPALAIAHLEAALPHAEHGPPGELAELRFDLARALVDSGRDRTRGLALADAARATFEQLHDDAHLIELARWRAGAR